jgi:hypothetical protein
VFIQQSFPGVLAGADQLVRLVSGEKSAERTCAVLLSIERTVNEKVLRARVAPLCAEEVDPCGLSQDIEAN